jgi:large conductance mechanosensitive channel
VIREFREFINRGNVIDLAVAVVIGAAFGKVVTSLVDGIIMPPLGLLLARVDFTSLFVVLDSSKGIPASLADARTQGIPVIAYGAFFNDIVNFVIIAFAVFVLVKQANRLKAPPAAAATRTCPFCLSDNVPIKASRCASCCADFSALSSHP